MIDEQSKSVDAGAPFFAEGTPAMLELERMIDRVGLHNVLFALEHICNEKAAHIEHAWQDMSLAKIWRRDALLCYRSARKVSFAVYLKGKYD